LAARVELKRECAMAGSGAIAQTALCGHTNPA
jgi:hypothetical protein